MPKDDLNDLQGRKLVSSRLQQIQQPAPKTPIYANIPNVSQPYANIPTFGANETIEFEKGDRNAPGPKQHHQESVGQTWQGKGRFVAQNARGLLFKPEGRDAGRDELVQFSPEQTKALRAADKAKDGDGMGVIDKSIQEGRDVSVSYWKDGAVHDWRVKNAPQQQQQQQRGGRG